MHRCERRSQGPDWINRVADVARSNPIGQEGAQALTVAALGRLRITRGRRERRKWARISYAGASSRAAAMIRMQARTQCATCTVRPRRPARARADRPGVRSLQRPKDRQASAGKPRRIQPEERSQNTRRARFESPTREPAAASDSCKLRKIPPVQADDLQALDREDEVITAARAVLQVKADDTRSGRRTSVGPPRSEAVRFDHGKIDVAATLERDQ